MAFWELSGGEIVGQQSMVALNIDEESAELFEGSLEVDELTFRQVFDSAAEVVEIGDLQEITLWRDGVRFFKGWVTASHVNDTTTGGFQVATTISGIWWWLEQTPLTSGSQGSDGGAVKERGGFAFAEGDLRTNIIAVVDRAKVLGVVIDVGGISPCFPTPEITLNQMSCADAIVELMRLIPDAVAFINYAGVVPTFNVKRRPYMAAELLTVGVKPCTSISVNPRLELETTQVGVSYVERDVAGRTVFKEDVHGAAVNGKRQIFPVSGPELDTFLPNDLFDTYIAQTVPSGSVEAAALASIAGFDRAKDDGLTDELAFGSFGQNFYATAGAATGQSSPDFFSLPGVTYRTESGVNVDVSGKHILIGHSPPDWVKNEYGARQIVVAGTWWYKHMTQHGDVNDDLAEPAWHDGLSGVQVLKQGYMAGDGVAAWLYIKLYGAAFEFTAWVVDTSYSSSTTIYRSADYGFVKPPAGFAQGLKETQDFVPYEGTVTVAAEEVGDYDVRGRAININGSISKHETMKAMVQSVRMDLATGTTSIELGVPKRLGYLGIVNRFRRTASNNIKWLSGAGGGLGNSASSGGSPSTDDGTGATENTGLVHVGFPDNNTGGPVTINIVQDYNVSDYGLNGTNVLHRTIFSVPILVEGLASYEAAFGEGCDVRWKWGTNYPGGGAYRVTAASPLVAGSTKDEAISFYVNVPHDSVLAYLYTVTVSAKVTPIGDPDTIIDEVDVIINYSGNYTDSGTDGPTSWPTTLTNVFTQELSVEV